MVSTRLLLESHAHAKQFKVHCNFAVAHAEEAADAEDDCSNLTVFAKNDFIDVADCLVDGIDHPRAD